MRFRDMERAPALTELTCAGGCGEKSYMRTGVVSYTCAKCTTRIRNVADTGRPDMRRVWKGGRHARRRMTGVSRSRAGR